jgi:hypothetical protein
MIRCFRTLQRLDSMTEVLCGLIFLLCILVDSGVGSDVGSDVAGLADLKLDQTLHVRMYALLLDRLSEGALEIVSDEELVIWSVQMLWVTM